MFPIYTLQKKTNKIQMCVSVIAKTTKLIFQFQFLCKADCCLLIIASEMPLQILRPACVLSFNRKPLSREVTQIGSLQIG